MGNLVFRDLRADEIDCRVATINEKGLSLLLYKDARCDMNILDETVGAFNWQREHSRDNANCVVAIWDEEKGMWIRKEDTGTESNTEAQKGLASDSFKRACFNWGIGRELYTAPFIWIAAGNYNATTNKAGKPATFDRFEVADIMIKDKKIIGLSIRNCNKRSVVFTYGKLKSATARDKLRDYMSKNGIDQTIVVNACGLNASSTDKDFENALNYAKSLVEGNGQLPFPLDQ